MNAQQLLLFDISNFERVIKSREIDKTVQASEDPKVDPHWIEYESLRLKGCLSVHV